MKRLELEIAWGALFSLGFFLVAIDVIANTLVSVGGVPALGVIGGALILLVFSSILNWLFKEAWNERNRNGKQDDT